MAVRTLKEFTNQSSDSKSTQQSKETVTQIIQKQRFELSEGSDDIKGLAIAPNGLAAVDYNLENKSFAVRPDNDLALDSQTLSKFKNDITACEKLATQLSKMGV